MRPRSVLSKRLLGEFIGYVFVIEWSLIACCTVLHVLEDITLKQRQCYAAAL